jgi:hypothetical protein
MVIEELLSTIMDVGIPVLFPVAFFAVIVLIKRRYQKRAEAWQAAANHMGFQFTYFIASARSFRMGGLIDQVPVQVKVVVRGSGKQQSWYTVAVADLPSDLPTGLLVGKESFFSGIGNALGFGDIEIGIPSVDDVLNVRGEDEVQVREYLATVSVQETLVELVSFGTGSGLRLSDVYLRKSGVVADTRTLISMARKAVRISQRLCGEGGVAEAAPLLEEHTETARPIEPILMPPDSIELTSALVAESVPEASEVDVVEPVSDWQKVSLLLADRNTRRSERRKVAKQVEGNVVAISLVIKRTSLDLDSVDSTTGARGALVYGEQNGLDMELKIAPQDAAVVADMKTGDSIEGTGVIVEWDQFYGRMKVDFRP